ncbi:MAG: PEGA domain-containing protein [Myxococcales bacterium]|nr:PEGA domain-containing protein [Myxococcales bacterium]
MFGWSGAAHAEDEAALTKRMVQLFKLKKYQEAIVVTKKLYSLNSQAKYLANIGRCYDLLRDDHNALFFYQRFLREEKNPERRTTILERVAVLRQRYSLIRREINILSDPTGADVLIDGKLQASQTPTVVWLAFGRHVIEVRKSGLKSVKREFEVTQGPTLTLDLRLEKPLAPQDPRGVLTLTANLEGAQVYLNGVLVGVTPLVGRRVRAGRYRVEVVSKAHKKWLREIEVEKGQTLRLMVELQNASETPTELWPETKKRSIKIAAGVMTGVGLAALSTALALYFVARRNYLDADCTVLQDTGIEVCKDQSKRDKSSRLNKYGAIPMWIVGGAASAAALTLWIVYATRPKGTRRDRAFWLVPTVSPSYTGLMTHVEF